MKIFFVCIVSLTSTLAMANSKTWKVTMVDIKSRETKEFRFTKSEKQSTLVFETPKLKGQLCQLTVSIQDGEEVGQLGCGSNSHVASFTTHLCGSMSMSHYTYSSDTSKNVGYGFQVTCD